MRGAALAMVSESGAAYSAMRGCQRALNLFCGANHRLRILGSRMFTDSVNRSRQAYGGNDVSAVVNRRADRGDTRASFAGALGPALKQGRLFSEQQPSGRSLLNRDQRAKGNPSAKLLSGLHRDDGQALLAASHKKLGAFACFFRQTMQDRAGELREAGRGETSAGNKKSVVVPSQKAMHLKGAQQAMRRCFREAQRFGQLKETHRLPGLDDVQQEHRLIQHTYAANHVVHGGMVIHPRRIDPKPRRINE